MIVPVLFVLGVAGVVYYLARTPVAPVGEVVGADDVEVTLQPYHVVVSPYHAASATFGSLHAPTPESATEIARVAVTGGTRWVPLWDKRSVVRDHPSRVEVLLKGEASPRVFTGSIDQAVVRGGTRLPRTQYLRAPGSRWLSWLRP